MKLVKTCPKCNTVFEEEVKKGYSRTFCSRKCSNSRQHSATTLEKIIEGSKKAWDSRSDSSKQKAMSNLLKGTAAMQESVIKRMLETPTEQVGHSSRKKKVFLEQGEKCNKCGVADWNGEPLTFELEHKDGNKFNNIRDNLEVLCPNCHSQTMTWRGRNNKGRLA